MVDHDKCKQRIYKCIRTFSAVSPFVFVFVLSCRGQSSNQAIEEECGGQGVFVFVPVFVFVFVFVFIFKEECTLHLYLY